ncbi:MAG: rod shape-determining protein RodA, partial [Crocinitomicaceae bacterium]
MRKDDKLFGELDWPLFITFMLMVFMGLMTIYSVAFNPEHSSIFDIEKQYGKQIIWISVSLFLGLIVFLIDSDIYRKYAFPIYLFTLSLLVLVLFMPPINGARAWIGVANLGIQPAEFAKIASALLLARYISELNIKQLNTSSVFLAILILLVPMTLILLQPDAGTFVVFTSFLFVMYREGLTFDPIILKFINAYPGVKFKQTWVGTHFIPILFVLIFISIVTLLLSNMSFYLWFSDEPVNGSMGIILFLTLLAILAIIFIQRFGNKREKGRMMLIILLGFGLTGGLSFLVGKSFSSLAPHQKDRIELFLGLKEDPNGKDYNRNRAMSAVGSGGWSGKG